VNPAANQLCSMLVCKISSVRSKSHLFYTWGSGFARAAPVSWSSLPLTIRTSSSLAIFKKQLKTFVFKKAFNLLE